MKSDETRIPRIEWVYIKVRHAVAAGVVLVALLCGALGLYLYSGGSGSERQAARIEIEAARRALERLSLHLAEAGVRDVVKQAEEQLTSAQSQFAARHFLPARSDALRARTLAEGLLVKLRPGSDFGPAARFFRIEGEVTVRRAGSLTWERASLVEPLHAGDGIHTSSTGLAEVMYSDGRLTTVQPASLVEIGALTAKAEDGTLHVTEALASGALHVEPSATAPAGSTHSVTTRTARAVADITNAQMEVAFDPTAGQTRLDVEAGEVQLESGGGSLRVAADMRVEVDPEGHPGPPLRITRPPSLIAPEEGRILRYVKPSETATTLAWTPVPGASEYRLSAGRSPLLGGAADHRIEVVGTSTRLAGLDTGWWFWRVTGRDGKGLEGRPSPIGSFLVVGPGGRRPGDGRPPSLQVSKVIQAGPLAIFEGRTEPGVDLSVGGRRVLPEADGSFTAVVRLPRPGANSVKLAARDVSGAETTLERTAYRAE